MDYFEEYTKKYDLSNDKLSYKYYHSKRVMNGMSLLSEKLNLSDNDIYLAKIIGLFHDIGRFEQYKRYKSFDDEYLDHGSYGAMLLKDNNVLTKTNISPKDYEIVYKAIDNHNKYKISTNLTEREKLFSKMIRDADKLDILYALSNEKIKLKIREDNEPISDKVRESFFKEELILTSIEQNESDHIVTLFSFIYDINFNETIALIIKNKYYEKIFDRLENKEKYQIYLDYLKKYLKERMK